LSRTRIRLPADGWRARPYQAPVWRYFKNGGSRAACVWHRRAGKDEFCLHLAAVKAHQRPATYWHMLPEAAQARKAIWEAVNPHTGRRRIDEAFPRAVRETTRENEMLIRFRCGSTWQVVGSDNFNSLIGSPPAGVVFSEYALADPSAWNFIRPILAENGGWASFIYTPRGPNHGQDLYLYAKSDPAWFAELLTVDDTGAIAPDVLAQEKRELIAQHGEHGEALFRQEYYCSFTAAIIGAYYGREMDAAETAGRIVANVYDPGLAVHTAWDLGLSDHTAIWFYQQSGFDIRLVDYYAASGFGLDHYAKVLQGRGYAYGRHLWPHDGARGELGTGKTLRETAAGLGLTMSIVKKLPVEDGINAVRRILPRCWVDRNKCAEGIKALRQYRREWDDARKVFYERPLHDWASHPADAFRTLAVGLQEPSAAAKALPQRDLRWVV
jgi:phage terminase large subunit